MSSYVILCISLIRQSIRNAWVAGSSPAGSFENMRAEAHKALDSKKGFSAFVVSEDQKKSKLYTIHKGGTAVC